MAESNEQEVKHYDEIELPMLRAYIVASMVEVAAGILELHPEMALELSPNMETRIVYMNALASLAGMSSALALLTGADGQEFQVNAQTMTRIALEEFDKLREQGTQG